MGFFGVLALLATTAVSVEVWFNLHQQLTPTQVDQAQALWKAHAPPDYELEYTVTRQSRDRDHFLAEVRDGEVAAIHVNGEVLDPALYPFYDVPPLFEQVRQRAATGPAGADLEVEYTAPAHSTATFTVEVGQGQVVSVSRDGQQLPPKFYALYGMPALFAGMTRFLELDARSSKQGSPFTIAAFEKKDGHLLHYVRSLQRMQERVEFRLVRFNALTPIQFHF
jgi:hypothetical protein